MSEKIRERYEFGPYRLDVGERTITSNGHSLEHPLPEKAFQTLVILLRHPGRLLSKESLISAVWPNTFVEENNLDKCIWHIRRSLGEKPGEDKYIETIRKHGYRFVAKVVRPEPSGIIPMPGLDIPDKVQEKKQVVRADVVEDPCGPHAGRLRRVVPFVVPLAIAVAVHFMVTSSTIETGAPSIQQVSANRMIDPSAEDAYLKGLYYFDEATNNPDPKAKYEGRLRAIAELEKAIAIAPDYASAYSAYARVLHSLGSAGHAEYYPRAKEAAMMAISLNDHDAEAFSALAWVLWRYDWDWEGAERTFRRAIDLPENPTHNGYGAYAHFLSASGRHKEAISLVRLYERGSHLKLSSKLNAAFVRLRAREYATCEIEFRRIEDLNPEQVRLYSGLAICVLLLGRTEEALQIAQKIDNTKEHPQHRLTRAWIFARAGREDEARDLLEKAVTDYRPEHADRDAIAIAKVCAGLDDADAAFDWLERAYRSHSQYLVYLNVEPEFDSLRGDPRFAELVRRIGIPQ